MGPDQVSTVGPIRLDTLRPGSASAAGYPDCRCTSAEDHESGGAQDDTRPLFRLKGDDNQTNAEECVDRQGDQEGDVAHDAKSPVRSIRIISWNHEQSLLQRRRRRNPIDRANHLDYRTGVR